MIQFWSAMSVVIIAVPAAVLMIWGWRSRVRRQRTIEALPAVPEAALRSLSEAGSGALRPAHHGKYVATTSAGDRYDRIAVRGLAFRGFAAIAAGASGVLVARDGEPAVWIAADRLVGIDRATWAIDRVVEQHGLHLLRWRLGDREVDTYLRLDEPAAFDEDLRESGLPIGRLDFPPTKSELRRAAKQARREASVA